MVAVIVRTGMKRAFHSSGMRAALPVTIITVIVSPMARPTPSITATMTPDLAAGNTTRQMVCQ